MASTVAVIVGIVTSVDVVVLALVLLLLSIKAALNLFFSLHILFLLTTAGGSSFGVIFCLQKFCQTKQR